jgi:hypothetical protein
MEEETAAGAEAPHAACPFCTLLPMLERRWPEASRGHFKNARIEFLRGVRGLIDDRIERLSKEERKGAHVVVE